MDGLLRKVAKFGNVIFVTSDDNKRDTNKIEDKIKNIADVLVDVFFLLFCTTSNFISKFNFYLYSGYFLEKKWLLKN